MNMIGHSKLPFNHILSDYLPLNIPDVGILLPDALEVGELQLEAGEAGREHGVGLCHLWNSVVQQDQLTLNHRNSNNDDNKNNNNIDQDQVCYWTQQGSKSLPI